MFSGYWCVDHALLLGADERMFSNTVDTDDMGTYWGAYG